MKRKLVSVLMMAFVVAVVGMLGSCKDYDEDMYSDMQGQLSDQSSLREALEQKVDNMKEQLDAIKSCQCDIDGKLNNFVTSDKFNDAVAMEIAKEMASNEGLGKVLEDLNQGINDANRILNDPNIGNQALANKLSELNGIAIEADKIAKAALALAQRDSIRLDEVNDTILSWGPKLTEAYTKAAEAYAKAVANGLAIEALQEICNGRIDSLAVVAKSHESDIEDLKTLAANNLADAKNYAKHAVDSLGLEIDGKLGTLTEAYEKADSILREDLEALTLRVDAIEGRLDDIDSQIADLTNRFAALNKLITSLLVQGTVNPVVGYAALPVNMRSNILAAYYGKAEGLDIEFPTMKTHNYVWAEEALTEKDLQMIGGLTPFTAAAGEVLLSEKEGNAGKLYLTVNPTYVDFSNTKFTLVNSLDEESGIKLGALKPSTDKLTFGVGTRAANAKNGFYEAPANLTADNIDKVKIVVDQNFKDAIKDVLDRKDGVDIAAVASAVYQQLNGLLDANAVKASWGTDSSTYSHYAIAATAIKPLSYAFLKDGVEYKIPSITPLEQLDIKFEFKDITIEAGDYFVTIEQPKIENGQIVTDENGNVVYEEKKYPIDAIDDLIEDLNGQLNDQLQDMIDDVNNQITSSIGSYMDRFNGYINKVNSWIDRINNVIANANNYLQVAMLYKTDKGTYAQLSNEWAVPTIFTLKSTGANQYVNLNPSSYTAELLAPAYKKHIAVTNVFTADHKQSAQGGNQNCLDALKLANSTAADGNNTFMNQVLDGGRFGILFTTNEKYKTLVYEIAYSALDYTGHITTKKFYLKVK